MKKILLACVIFFTLINSNAASLVKYDVAISFDSERIAYSVYGTGETSLIFIHGWSCDSRYWYNQIEQFSEKYQVITIDLAGHGNSSANRDNYTMLAFAEDIKSVITKNKINKAILIGHSMGGGVIAEAARLMPDRVIAVIGVDTLQNIAEKVPQKLLDDMSSPFEKDFATAMQGFILPMFPEGSDKYLVNWVEKDMSSADKRVALSAFRNYMGQYVDGSACKVFKDVTIPVVSINARLWPTNPESNKKYFKDYKLYYIEKSGHFPMLEKPKKFNELLTDALIYIERKK